MSTAAAPPDFNEFLQNMAVSADGTSLPRGGIPPLPSPMKPPLPSSSDAAGTTLFKRRIGRHGKTESQPVVLDQAAMEQLRDEYRDARRVSDDDLSSADGGGGAGVTEKDKKKSLAKSITRRLGKITMVRGGTHEKLQTGAQQVVAGTLRPRSGSKDSLATPTLSFVAGSAQSTASANSAAALPPSSAAASQTHKRQANMKTIMNKVLFGGKKEEHEEKSEEDHRTDDGSSPGPYFGARNAGATPPSSSMDRSKSAPMQSPPVLNLSNEGTMQHSESDEEETLSSALRMVFPAGTPYPNGSNISSKMTGKEKRPPSPTPMEYRPFPQMVASSNSATDNGNPHFRVQSRTDEGFPSKEELEKMSSMTIESKHSNISSSPSVAFTTTGASSGHSVKFEIDRQRLTDSAAAMDSGMVKNYKGALVFAKASENRSKQPNKYFVSDAFVANAACARLVLLAQHDHRIREVNNRIDSYQGKIRDMNEVSERIKRLVMTECRRLVDLVDKISNDLEVQREQLRLKENKYRETQTKSEHAFENTLELKIEEALRPKEQNFKNIMKDSETRLKTLSTLVGGSIEQAGLLDSAFHRLTELALLGAGTVIYAVTGIYVSIKDKIFGRSTSNYGGGNSASRGAGSSGGGGVKKRRNREAA